VPAYGDGARGAQPVAAEGETRGGESRAGETCQRANAQGLVERPFLGTAPGDGRRWGRRQTVLAGGCRSREARGNPPGNYGTRREMPSFCMRNCRVERFSPRRTAAPCGPATTHLG
jgi:hypothetical protein